MDAIFGWLKYRRPTTEGHGVGYVTDDDPKLEYRMKLGSGGFGMVHEVLCYRFSKVDLDPRYSIAESLKLDHL